MERMRSKINDLNENSKFTLKSIDNKVELKNVDLRSYQKEGIKWLIEHYENEIGCCLCDEMGLGKTCQTIGLLAYIAKKKPKSRILVISPLSVVNNWSMELEKFAPWLTKVVYVGDKEARSDLEKEFSSKTIILTTYELIIKDLELFQNLTFEILVVDEGHRLKNSNSLLYQYLDDFDTKMRVLLTGTPIQNNLDELYSLLSFIQPNVFKLKHKDEFVQEYSKKLKEISEILEVFILRRMKSQVNIDLPEKSEVILYHGLTELQKKTYKAVLLKDIDAFNGTKKVKLMNILMCLRKICSHPYLMPNIEPEPFELGEHLVDSSGKLKLLDTLLHHLFTNGHKVLIFSQFTMVLDLLQDYLTYREYSYERLDGSIRSEERNMAISNFNQNKDTFVFLLSTKAGGVGLNLVSADTCIFLDNDFNPQNDLQAAARCHRIGQTRPVLIIRLIAKSTVEEVIYSRALAKLKLSTEVMDSGITDINPTHLSDILKYGLDELFGDETSSLDDKVDFIELLGDTKEKKWIFPKAKSSKNDVKHDIKTIYEFEGEDYSSERDKNRFNSILKESNLTENQSLKRKKPVVDDEEAKRRKIEADEARKKRLEEQKRRADERLKQKWQENDYKSMKIEYSDDEDEKLDEDIEPKQINYVKGDVTRPSKYAKKTNAIIIHCVDNSGTWGRGGLFDALNTRSSIPSEHYELACKMKDLKFKDVHLIDLGIRNDEDDSDENDQLALIVAHKRDKNNHLSPLSMEALDECFKAIYHKAVELKASIHMPRIGYKTPNFNWYGVEKLVKKHFSNRGLDTYIYYFDKKTNKQSKANKLLPDFFTGMTFYFPKKFSNLLTYEQIERYVIAYNGTIEEDPLDASNVTHLVLKSGEKAPDGYESTTKVDVSWVEQCILKKKLVDIQKFLL